MGVTWKNTYSAPGQLTIVFDEDFDTRIFEALETLDSQELKFVMFASEHEGILTIVLDAEEPPWETGNEFIYLEDDCWLLEREWCPYSLEMEAREREWDQPSDAKQKSPKAQKGVSGWVYILRDAQTKRFAVIGRSKHMEVRLDWYGKTLPYDLELIGAIYNDDYVEEEARLHRRFANKNIRGEWFELGLSDYQWLKSQSGWDANPNSNGKPEDGT